LTIQSISVPLRHRAEWRSVVAATARALAPVIAALVGATALIAGVVFAGGGGRSAAVAPAARRPGATSRAAVAHEAGAARSDGLSHAGLLSLPATARAPVSAALGADTPAYRVRAVAGGYTASNPAQLLRASFGRTRVTLSAGATHLSLSLQAWGYAASLRALAGARPRAIGNRVSYTRGGVGEWYANGPLGVEQGFTIAHPPAGPARGPLTLSMKLGGNARAALAPNGQGVAFKLTAGPSLRYGEVRATDARGNPLHGWLTLSGARRLRLHVDARGARYPLRIDPLVHQGAKLTVSGLGGPYGYVGMSVALSADGDTVLIGAPADDEYTGSVWVFTRSGATWTQQARLAGSGTVGESWFGESVALSANGDTALIGAPSDDGAMGAAWVFTRSGGTWTQQGEKLTGAGESGQAFFARSVALSANGDTAMIGGYQDDEHRGAAWVFTRSGSTWTQQGGKLTSGGEAIGFFGWDVSLSAAGTTALISEWAAGEGVGAAWVFTRSGSRWEKQSAALTPAGASGYPWFGYSLALSASGNTALIGAPHAEGYAGDAWVFQRTGSTWTQQGEPLTGGEGLGEGELGYSSALSADGDRALVGGRVDDGFDGAAWTFVHARERWSQDGGKLIQEERSGREEFGWSVALASAGDTALVGSPCDQACIGSASAFVSPLAPPEFGRCEKVPDEVGEYAGASCTSTGAKADYEWDQGVAGGFTTKLTSATAALATRTGAKVTCLGETGVGDYTETTQVDDVKFTFTGCEQGGQSCESAGAEQGEVVSRPLEGTLGVEKLGASASKDKVGLDLFPDSHSGALLEFACGATDVSVRGSVIAPMRANKMAATAALDFKASKGRQKPENFVDLPKDVLEASFGGGAYEQAGLTLLSTQTSGEALEIDTDA
jgi:hypothetical protein